MVTWRVSLSWHMMGAGQGVEVNIIWPGPLLFVNHDVDLDDQPCCHSTLMVGSKTVLLVQLLCLLELSEINYCRTTHHSLARMRWCHSFLFNHLVWRSVTFYLRSNKIFNSYHSFSLILQRCCSNIFLQKLVFVAASSTVCYSRIIQLHIIGYDSLAVADASNVQLAWLLCVVGQFQRSSIAVLPTFPWSMLYCHSYHLCLVLRSMIINHGSHVFGIQFIVSSQL